MRITRENTSPNLFREVFSLNLNNKRENLTKIFYDVPSANFFFIHFAVLVSVRICSKTYVV